MSDATLAWLDAITYLGSGAGNMKAIEELEAALDGPAKRFLELSAGSEPLHRLALSRALVGPKREASVAEYRQVVKASWSTALKAAYESPLLRVVDGRIMLRDRVEEILLGRPVGSPLALPEVRPEVREAVTRVKPQVAPGPLMFQCSDRDFTLEYARAWVGEGLSAWTVEGASSTAWARLQADQSLLWLAEYSRWRDCSDPAPEGLQFLGGPPTEEGAGLTGVLLEPLLVRLNSSGALAPTDEDEEPHLADTAWSTPSESLDALVLPDESLHLLRSVEERARTGQRCVVLLHGPPGTGKSLAARCLAGSLGRRVYNLDGGRLRGKFFGQFERRLSGVFERMGQDVLVIDEADGWLGRREGTSAGECSARLNAVTSLLLMLEHFRGVAVLTTNRLETLDPAVWRRVDVEVAMPTPGPLERMALWGRVGPTLKPTTLAVLAALPLTGGDIEAAATEAALRGTSETHLVAAARRRAERRRLLG